MVLKQNVDATTSMCKDCAAESEVAGDGTHGGRCGGQDASGKEALPRVKLLGCGLGIG